LKIPECREEERRAGPVTPWGAHRAEEFYSDGERRRGGRGTGRNIFKGSCRRGKVAWGEDLTSRPGKTGEEPFLPLEVH